MSSAMDWLIEWQIDHCNGNTLICVGSRRRCAKDMVSNSISLPCLCNAVPQSRTSSCPNTCFRRQGHDHGMLALQGCRISRLAVLYKGIYNIFLPPTLFPLASFSDRRRAAIVASLRNRVHDHIICLTATELALPRPMNPAFLALRPP